MTFADIVHSKSIHFLQSQAFCTLFLKKNAKSRQNQKHYKPIHIPNQPVFRATCQHQNHHSVQEPDYLLQSF